MFGIAINTTVVKVKHMNFKLTFQGGFSFQLYKGCTKVFLGVYFWEHVVLQSSAVDIYNHWPFQAF